MRPLADRIIIEPVPDATTTEGGIVLPDIAQDEPTKGKVLFKGKGVEELFVGDLVLFPTYAGQKTKIDGKEIMICREEEILCVLESKHHGKSNGKKG